MIKYLLIALLSFPVTAKPDEKQVVIGICAVMVVQIDFSKPAINLAFVKFWSGKASEVNMSLIRYYNRCVKLLTDYHQTQTSEILI